MDRNEAFTLMASILGATGRLESVRSVNDDGSITRSAGRDQGLGAHLAVRTSTDGRAIRTDRGTETYRGFTEIHLDTSNFYRADNGAMPCDLHAYAIAQFATITGLQLIWNDENTGVWYPGHYIRALGDNFFGRPGATGPRTTSFDKATGVLSHLEMSPA